MSDDFTRRLLPAGTVIFEEGDRGDYGYIIEAGRVEISTMREGRRIVIAERGPGEIVGEMAIIDDGVRSATATVVEDGLMLLLAREQLQSRVASLDPVLRMVLSVVLTRFRDSISGSNSGGPAADPQERAPLYQTDLRSASERIELEHSIRSGLKKDEFELFYQPLVKARRRTIGGFEGLARWRHPENGLLGPDAFIEAAEESGLIGDLTHWAVRRACRDATRFNAGRTPENALFVSVNVTGEDLVESSFVDFVARCLAEEATDPSWLMLEITESRLVENPEMAIETMSDLRMLGVSIAIDDFGTGYSNLKFLAEYPIQKLKIDKSLLDQADVSARGGDVLKAFIELSGVLGLETVTEGVERADQAAFLADIGCDLLQGYHFGKPAPMGACFELLAAEATAEAV